MIKKFSKLNISAPTQKDQLEKTLQDLVELKEAFVMKGDEDKEKAKEEFIKEQKRMRGEYEEEEKK